MNVKEKFEKLNMVLYIYFSFGLQFIRKDTKFTGHRGLTWSGSRSCKGVKRKITFFTLSVNKSNR